MKVTAFKQNLDLLQFQIPMRALILRWNIYFSMKRNRLIFKVNFSPTNIVDWKSETNFPNHISNFAITSILSRALKNTVFTAARRLFIIAVNCYN